MAADAWQERFERIWAHREESIYPRLFGARSRGIFVLTRELFAHVFEQPDPDPRWLHCGVFEFAPIASRPSWLYVSSGLSNAWNDETLDPNGPSGLGCEFVFESTEQGDWAIERVAYVMAFQLLLSAGAYARKPILSCNDRIPLRSSITPEPSELTFLLVTRPDSFEADFQTESGRANFLQLVGISEAETRFAREFSGEELVQRLKEERVYLITDPKRKSIITPT